MPHALCCNSWHARSSSAPRTSRTITLARDGAWVIQQGAYCNVDLRVVFGTSVSKWLVLVALVALLWVARGVLPPFIIAGFLAYVLSPVVVELSERTGIRRSLVALGVFLCV